jgi:selenide,water dikinase
MRSGIAAMTDLVLLGAGHAHIEVLRRFARRPEPRLRLTLITREPRTPYSGRLPALVRGECAPTDAHIDLGPLSAAAHARLVMAEATAIELAERRVVVTGRPAVPFDLLSIDIGGVPAMPAGDGIAVRPIGTFLAELDRLERTLPPGARVALVGGGASGTELALALARRFGTRFRVVLVCDTPDPLYHAPPHAREVARAALTETRVELTCGVRAGEHAEGKLALSDGTFIEAAAVLWATHAVGPPLLRDAGLGCDAAGCVLVDNTLRSRSHGYVLAAGDCASIEGAPRPKAGVWAVRAGPVLADNLRRASRGQPLRRWDPQRSALAIMGLGNGRAVAWRDRLALSGRLVARYKDWVDARFLRRYGPAALPRPSVPAAASPVALDVADLGVISHRAGQNARAGLAPPAGAALTQGAVHLPAPLDDPFAFGQIAASHALAGLHAIGAQPWTASAIVTLPPIPEHHARADLLALLDGLAGVLAADGAALLDCATARGERLAISLVSIGLFTAGHGPRATLQAGDALILTKPLGSGTILEAWRRGIAEAAWLRGALETMRASNAPAARILRQHGASGCAAVAEHGVIGTLSAMLRAANLAAVLYRESIPALPGAAALARRGIAGAGADDNRLAWPDPPEGPEIGLLADPQIAGGLLAGVPADQAEACLAALAAAGCAAAAIGDAEPRRLDAPRLRLEAGTRGVDSEGN